MAIFELPSLNSLRGRRGRGYLRDKPNPDEQLIHELLGSRALGEPPSNASVFDSRVQPKNQLSTESCTGNAGAQGARLAYLKRGMDCPELSALQPYRDGRASLGIQNVDGGSTVSATLQAIIDGGICAESLWPMSVWRVNKTPDMAARRDAYDRRGLRGYYRIPAGNLTMLRLALAHGFPVIGGWDVDEAFMRDAGPRVIQRAMGKIVGGHAFVIEAYSADETFQMLNSWGRTWRIDGRALLSAPFVASGIDLHAVDVGEPMGMAA